MLEKRTRDLIDHKLKKQKRDVSNHRQVATEFPIDKNWTTLFADYVLFNTDGKEIYFYNSSKQESPRQVKTFFTINDFNRLKFLNETQISANSQQVNADIAWRHYQIGTIKSVVEWIDMGKRKFLLVIATWCSKTKTAMWLIDIILKTHNAQSTMKH